MDLTRVAGREAVSVSGEEREAAVLAPVVARESGAHVLFTKRADHLSDHPGQMSFPGGGREPADEDLLATALREANEEVGLEADDVGVVGRLDDVRTITDYQVRPFVVETPDREHARPAAGTDHRLDAPARPRPDGRRRRRPPGVTTPASRVLDAQPIRRDTD